MNKKWLITLVAFFTFALIIGGPVAANSNLFLGQFMKADVEVNGTMLSDGDVPPFIVNNRTVLPINKVAEMFNAYVSWDADRKVAVITKPIVNMSIIQKTDSSLQVNPPLKAKITHSFEVATRVSRVPKSKELKVRFTVTDKNDRMVHRMDSFTIDTSQSGNFNGNLSVWGLKLETPGEYILRLEMDPPDDSSSRFTSVGEYVIIVRD